jgi:hypothetical protein
MNSILNKKMLVFFIGLVLVGSGCISDSSDAYNPVDSYDSSGSYGSAAYSEKVISRDDAISEYWDDIRENLDGTEEIDDAEP